MFLIRQQAQTSSDKGSLFLKTNVFLRRKVYTTDCQRIGNFTRLYFGCLLFGNEPRRQNAGPQNSDDDIQGVNRFKALFSQPVLGQHFGPNEGQ